MTAEPLGIEGHLYVYRVTSGAVAYEVRIDSQTGEVDCSCKGFQYRFAGKNPTVVDRACKHVTLVCSQFANTESS